MGAAAKPPPFVCFKWPWGPSLNASPSPSPGPSPCGDLELPWLFKSIRTVAQDLLIAGDLPSPATGSGGGGAMWRKRRPGPATAVEADRGDAEQRALAAALASGRAATVLEFYSPRCRLCASLQGLVRELEGGADGSASFVLADAEDDRWLPEGFNFLILLDPGLLLDTAASVGFGLLDNLAILLLLDFLAILLLLDFLAIVAACIVAITADALIAWPLCPQHLLSAQTSSAL